MIPNIYCLSNKRQRENLNGDEICLWDEPKDRWNGVNGDYYHSQDQRKDLSPLISYSFLHLSWLTSIGLNRGQQSARKDGKCCTLNLIEELLKRIKRTICILNIKNILYELNSTLLSFFKAEQTSEKLWPQKHYNKDAFVRDLSLITQCLSLPIIIEVVNRLSHLPAILANHSHHLWRKRITICSPLWLLLL